MGLEVFHTCASQREITVISSKQQQQIVYYPTTNSGMQNGSLVGIYGLYGIYEYTVTHCIHIFCTFGVDFYAQSVLISTSELSQQFIESELLVVISK